MAKLRRSVEKEKFWRLAFHEYGQSGLSIRAFCQREGLAEPSFYAWRKKLGGSADRFDRAPVVRALLGDSLIPVRVVAASESSAQCVESKASARMEIRTPGGYTLRLGEDVELNRLNALLRVLASVQGEVASC